MKKWSFLFDMDGVLVDSEPVITKAAIEGLLRFGVRAREEDFKPFTGMGEIRFIGGVAEKYGVPYRPEMKDLVYDIYLTLVDDALYVYKDTRGTLAALRQTGCRLALASSADRVKVSANLRVAGIPEDTFGALVTGNDVERKKPEPDIYLAAAAAIGADPAFCIVVEDAVSGVQAAKSAGMLCVAVRTSFPDEALLAAGADALADDIGGVPAVTEKLLQRMNKL